MSNQIIPSNGLKIDLSRRRFLGGAVVVAGLAAVSPILSACGSADGAATAGGGSKLIGLSLNGLVEYSRYVGQGVAKALDGGDYKMKIVQANFDPQTELRNIESLTSQGVAGLVILPTSVDSITPPVREAHDADIPTSLAIWAAPGALDKYLSGVAAVDSVGGGKMIGEWLKANGKPGKTIVVQGVVGQGFSERIDEGLDASLAGSAFKVVAREQGFFDRNKAIGVVERALQAHPDATTIVSYAAAMGDGIASYLEQNKLDHITHVTSDGDTEMLKWMKTPYLAASRYYSAAETGSLAGGVVRQVVEGKKPTFGNPVFQTMMTAATMDADLKKNPMSYPEFDKALSGI